MQIKIVEDRAELDQGIQLLFLLEGQDLEIEWPGLVGLESGFSGKLGRARLVSGRRGLALVVGLGETENLDMDSFRAAVGAAVRAAASQEIEILSVNGQHLARLPLEGDVMAELVLAAHLTAHRFVSFKSEPGTEDCPASLLLWGTKENLPARVDEALAVAGGVCLARDLVNTPANVATPEYLAQMALSLGEEFSFKVHVFEPEEIVEMGMGCFASIFRGSDTPARFIVLDSDLEDSRPPLVFVGKGVTFDTGGISLKPAAKMHEMKGDMAGAAAILGLFKALGQAGGRGRRVVGILPCTENVPGSRAVKPGDVVTAMNGKTVEILNTDAEGRLILADALCYAARFEPEILVDLATLTGACLVALGTKMAAVFSDVAELESRIRESGTQVGERFWPMPLWADHGSPLQSDVADLKNMASREGAAIFAALFLQKFVPEGVDWAHLDIAGPAWTDGNTSIFRPGGTGFGVRTLWELIGFYED